MNEPAKQTSSSDFPQVFISYAHEDYDKAKKLCDDFTAAGFRSWLDKVNIRPGEDWKLAIERGIKESRFFVALLSPSLLKRRFVHREFKHALDLLEEFLETDIFIFPVRLEVVDIPYEKLKKYQYIDLFPDETAWKKGVKDIIQTMKEETQKDSSFNQRPVTQEDDNKGDISSTSTLKESQHLVQEKVPSPRQQPILHELFKGEKSFFVGRGVYIDKLIKDRLVSPGSVISIIGPGGSGKSQLAFKAMHKYVKDYGLFDLVIPIYLDTGILPFDRFLSEFAVKIGLGVEEFERNTTIEDRKNIIRNSLKGKKHLLIYLDNFETVSLVINRMVQVTDKEIEQSADSIIDFLENVVPRENTSILLTSRERVNNLVNEHQIDLEGLDIEDSNKLFSAYVRYPQFKNPDGELKDQIDELLKKTGGHPLSIEIIAKNIRSIDQLTDLSRVLGPLTENRGEQTERFKTLNASFKYINNILDTKLQELLPKLTLFKSPFPTSAAVEIFDISEDEVLDLYDRSLLKLVNSDELFGKVQDSEYWLYNFYLPVRGYVEDTMQKNGPSLHSIETEYGEALSNYYYNLLVDTNNSIGNESHRSSLARFNIIYQSEDNDFDRAIKLTTDKDQSAEISFIIGKILSNLGIVFKAAQYFTRGIEFYEQTDNNRRLKEIYKDTGIVFMYQGKLDDALNYHMKALAIDEDLNDRVGTALDYRNVGNIHYNMENYERALDYHNKALEIHEDLNDRVGMSGDYTNIGLVLSDMDNNQQALDYHKKALEIHTELNDRVGMAKDYTNIGLVLSNMGNNQQALVYHNKALEIDEDLNDRVGTALDYRNIGVVLSDMGNNQDALDYHKKSLAIHEDLNDRVGMAKDYSNIGVVLKDMGNYQQALDYHKKSLSIHEDLNDRVGMARDYGNIGFAFKEMNQPKEAIESVEKGLKVLLEFEKETGYQHPLIEKLKKLKESLEDGST